MTLVGLHMSQAVETASKTCCDFLYQATKKCSSREAPPSTSRLLTQRDIHRCMMDAHEISIASCNQQHRFVALTLEGHCTTGTGPSYPWCFNSIFQETKCDLQRQKRERERSLVTLLGYHQIARKNINRSVKFGAVHINSITR